MTVSRLIQLALLFAKIVNWITSKIDQREWEASGYRKAMEDELKAIGVSTGFAAQALKEAAAMTPEERRRALRDAV